MNTLRTVWHVAVWEFLRFFKWKEHAMGIVIGLMAALGFYGVRHIVEKKRAEPVEIIVVNATTVPVEAPPDSRFVFKVAPGVDDAAQARRQVIDGEADGLLEIGADGSVVLSSRKDPSWRRQLESLMTSRAQAAAVRDAGLPPETLARVLAPVALRTIILGDGSGAAVEAGSRRLGRAERIWAVVFVGIMLMGVLVGNAYLFIGITGEKQARMTEQVVSAISAQSWIDGKLLGLSLLSFASLLGIAASVIMFLLVGSAFEGRLLIAPKALSPLLLLSSATLALLGFYFWFAFFGAVAATIDNPYNSNRSVLLYFAMAPLSVAFFAMADPGAAWVRVAALVPLTSPTVLPVRIVAGEASAWEFLAACAILVAATWALRTAAGRIFRVGMLMYGKEPRLAEMWRWAREPDPTGRD